MASSSKPPDIGYTFRDPELLKTALTHPSCPLDEVDSPDNNQRLEFLGDAILGMVLAEWLYQSYPDEREGMMAKARAALAKGSKLAELAETIQLCDHLILGDPNAALPERGAETALEDAFEALIGAIFLDGGIDAARSFIRNAFGDLQPAVKAALLNDNPKGRLQEWAQAKNPQEPPYYKIISESGPAHAKLFTVQVIHSQVTMGTGTGHSKKEAEEQAALQAIQSINT